MMAMAASIPQASDVILVYDNANTEQQGKYNFLFTVQNDPIIYPCEGNRCSMVNFRALGEATITVYKLPEGFPRVAGLQDQAKLQEYINQADQHYRLTGIATNWDTTSDGRPYQLVYLSPDGSYRIEAETYSKPSTNSNVTTATDRTTLPKWLWGLIGIGTVVIVIAGALWWRIRRL